VRHSMARRDWMQEQDSSIHSLIVQYLVAHTRCSGCGQHYETEDVHVHSHRGQVWLASMTCRQCGLRAMVMAALQPDGIPPEHADPEQAAWQAMGPISDDEVLDLHRFLEGFRGDMQDLMRS
jgi:hypothetical protein